MNKNLLIIMEALYFASKVVFYMIIWIVGVNYLSKTEYVLSYIWLIVSGIIGAILWIVLPIMRNKFAKDNKKVKNK